MCKLFHTRSWDSLPLPVCNITCIHLGTDGTSISSVLLLRLLPFPRFFNFLGLSATTCDSLDDYSGYRHGCCPPRREGHHALLTLENSPRVLQEKQVWLLKHETERPLKKHRSDLEVPHARHAQLLTRDAQGKRCHSSG